MESKYYTPDISEFYIGFIFEVQQQEELYGEVTYSEEWLEFEFQKNNTIPDLKYCRVKYLDKEDIEELGFEKNVRGTHFNKGDYQLYLDIHPVHNVTIYDDYPRMIFQGTVKNKSELKKLLKQLRV